jgi:hypothetical protein
MIDPRILLDFTDVVASLFFEPIPLRPLPRGKGEGGFWGKGKGLRPFPLPQTQYSPSRERHTVRFARQIVSFRERAYFGMGIESAA